MAIGIIVLRTDQDVRVRTMTVAEIGIGKGTERRIEAIVTRTVENTGREKTSLQSIRSAAKSVVGTLGIEVLGAMNMAITVVKMTVVEKTAVIARGIEDETIVGTTKTRSGMVDDIVAWRTGPGENDAGVVAGLHDHAKTESSTSHNTCTSCLPTRSVCKYHCI